MSETVLYCWIVNVILPTDCDINVTRFMGLEVCDIGT